MKTNMVALFVAVLLNLVQIGIVVAILLSCVPFVLTPALFYKLKRNENFNTGGTVDRI